MTADQDVHTQPMIGQQRQCNCSPVWGYLEQVLGVCLGCGQTPRTTAHVLLPSIDKQ